MKKVLVEVGWHIQMHSDVDSGYKILSLGECVHFSLLLFFFPLDCFLG